MNTRTLACLIALMGLGVLPGATAAQAQIAEPVRMHVNSVDMSYVELGSGPPVVLLHGGIGDYSTWQPQMEPLARSFRVIAYSRPYSFPNNNPPMPKTYTPWTDVEDLAALIRELHLQDVRLVGQSAGGFIALGFALKHPEVVHSLVLSEPPAHQLVRGTADGEAVYQDFMSAVWIPAAATSGGTTRGTR